MNAEKKTFVKAGEPVAVMGSGTKAMRREGDALVIPPDARWGNPLFADVPLNEEDFRIHARLTLPEVGGTEASFLLGGHYHYPCSRSQGNVTLRVSLDDDMWVYDGSSTDTEPRIVHGMTLQRGSWIESPKEVGGKTCDHIQAGKPFDLDWVQKGKEGALLINGNEVFRTTLEGKIEGMKDGGWPVMFGFLPDLKAIRLHDLWAEGSFAEANFDLTDVWTQGHDGYCTYRIPSLCVTPEGTLLAFCEARRFDFTRYHQVAHPNADEVHCVMKRSTDGGKTWSEQKSLVALRHTYEARDPSPVVDRETGDVFLLLRGPHIMKIENDGESWSAPRPLGAGGAGTPLRTAGPCQGIQIVNGKHRGRLVVPFYGRGDRASQCGVAYSDDHGATWKEGGLTVPGTTEPQLVELSDGALLLNCRTSAKEHGRSLDISRDGGDTFEQQRFDSVLPSGSCQASLLRYGGPEAGKRPILYSSPDEGRRKMTVRASRDDCESWPVSRPVYSGHSAYSALATLPDGRIGLLFERDGYRRLSFAALPAEGLAD